MKNLILSCCVAAALAQVSMANPHEHSSHSPDSQAHQSPESTFTQEVLDLMHTSMMEAKFTESGNPNIDFLQNMIPHHKGAILSSQKLLQSKDLHPKLKKIAQAIITAQEKEIAYFTKLLGNEAQLRQEIDKEQYQQFVQQAKQDMQTMMQAMHKSSQESSSNDAQSAYMESMIAHHQGAIDAARQILSISNNATIKKIANAIIAAQESEIKEFRAMLADTRNPLR
ncbi:DUF305 domain-containing protein [Helicobacter canis]|uniref:DUF305 domain-containing protein n=1 Tax=Helicobacter canis TaxID=29419 RepID=UPI0026EEA275|nr:DUF305 domain-containing protein [Helicobacter canis]